MRRKAGRFMILTFVIICIVLFGAAGSVKAQRQTEHVRRERQYREREEELLTQIRTYLTGRGFLNSGVTLNRTVKEERDRIYTVTVHHSRIDRMREEERERLGEQLEDLCGDMFRAGPEESCRFQYRFLILEDVASDS